MVADDLHGFSRARPHPWHGLSPGPHIPEIVTAYIEITPFDLVKYEVDKVSGYLRVDRPQATSSLPPSLYGFIPQTYCGKRVGALSQDTGQGDEDPLDICVITGRPVGRSDMIITARVLGVVRATDGGRADDKIVAVMQSDPIWGGATDIDDLPEALTEPLCHYFATYKVHLPDTNPMVVHGLEDKDKALELIEAALKDYQEMLG